LGPTAFAAAKLPPSEPTWHPEFGAGPADVAAALWKLPAY